MFHLAVQNGEGEVAIEGMHLVEEAIRSGLRPITVFFSESAQVRAHELLPQLPSRTETLLLPDPVLRAQPALIVIAAGLQDPAIWAQSPARRKPLARRECCWAMGP